jgi:hypothetical protein
MIINNDDVAKQSSGLTFTVTSITNPQSSITGNVPVGKYLKVNPQGQPPYKADLTVATTLTTVGPINSADAVVSYWGYPGGSGVGDPPTAGVAEETTQSKAGPKAR